MSEYPNKKDIDNSYFYDLKEHSNKIKPPKSIFKGVKRIIAIGDIHGDFDALLKALYIGKVIDMKGKWIGGDTHVVQVGDLLDKGGRGLEDNSMESDDSEWRSIIYLEALREQARKQNGNIHLLLGNHELMNVTSNLNYTTPQSNDYFGGEDVRVRLFSRGGFMAKKLASLFNCVVKIDDWVFSHAGILPERLIPYGSDITRLNEDIREYLKNPEYKNDTLGDIIENENSILWTRFYGKNNSEEVCSKVRQSLKIINGKDDSGGMVIGHSIQKHGIESVCDNQLHRIDVGMSSAFGKEDKKIQVLEILNNKDTKVLN